MLHIPALQYFDIAHCEGEKIIVKWNNSCDWYKIWPGQQILQAACCMFILNKQEISRNLKYMQLNFGLICNSDQ